MKAENIKAAIVEREGRRRDKLVSAINFTPGFRCVGSYGTLAEALLGFAGAMPDIVLCSFHFLDRNEQKVIRALRKQYRYLPILILNLYSDGENIFDTAEFAVGGCLLKLTIPAELLENPRAARRGAQSFLDTIAANLCDSFKSRLSSEEAETYSLTPHEIRLLKLLIEGHNHTASAKILNVSYNTVKFHMRRIYQKLEVNSKSAAVAKAMRYRLTE